MTAEQRIRGLEFQNMRYLDEITEKNKEITALRRKLVGVSEVLDALLDCGKRTKIALDDCRQVLEMMQAEVDRRD